jgi:hypothetical protein
MRLGRLGSVSASSKVAGSRAGVLNSLFKRVANRKAVTGLFRGQDTSPECSIRRPDLIELGFQAVWTIDFQRVFSSVFRL